MNRYQVKPFQTSCLTRLLDLAAKLKVEKLEFYVQEVATSPDSQCLLSISFGRSFEVGILNEEVTISGGHDEREQRFELPDFRSIAEMIEAIEIEVIEQIKRFEKDDH